MSLSSVNERRSEAQRLLHLTDQGEALALALVIFSFRFVAHSPLSQQPYTFIIPFLTVEKE